MCAERNGFLQEKAAPLCNMAIVGRNEQSRNSRELCRYGNNGKKERCRDGERYVLFAEMDKYFLLGSTQEAQMVFF